MGKAERARARGLFARGLPVAQVAAKMGAAKRTVQRWKAADAAAGLDWGAARAAELGAKGAIEAASRDYLAGALALQAEVLSAIKADAGIAPMDKTAALASLADSFNKTVRACAGAAPGAAQAAIAADTLNKLAAFAAGREPAEANAVLDAIEAFLPVLAQDYA